MYKTKLNMAQKLKMFREINDYSQESLGNSLNVSAKTISAWENEERDISLQNAIQIANFFNVPQEYFVFDENEEKLDSRTKENIHKYLDNLEFVNKIKTIISSCKKKLENDGLPYKKEYLPVFNYEQKDFESYGIFEKDSIPVKIQHNHSRFQFETQPISFTNSDLTDLNQYQYSSSALARVGLYDILIRFNKNKVELKDLTNCNNLDIFKTTLTSMKERKYTKKNNYPHNETIDISQDYIQEQLNNVLENLDPNLSNFWAIVVFLIENGAYFTLQIGDGSDVVCWNYVKDTSRTNYIYRIAKDNLNK